MTKREIMNYLWGSDLRASEVVKLSGGFVGLNQASGWVRKLRGGQYLSNPVTVMLWKILKERDGLGVYDVPEIKKGDVNVIVESLSPNFDTSNGEVVFNMPKRMVSAELVDTREAVNGGSSYYKGSDRERLDRIEKKFELELSKLGTEIELLSSRIDSYKKQK